MFPELHRRLIRLERDDYQGGDRPLVVRVSREPTPTADPDWCDLHGIHIAGNGDRLGERLLRVRTSALRDRLESEGL
ncbi:hypothetical protein [Micromonospora sp. NBC_01796]|uniref:hypothetical protein n=1 Tax=Micromonospora sp. NBC_01796 TaxID=2975987 RepID=UPI002DDADA7A|nr:hypothetical protein [Micromonospora sp. NBC_01796]WSA86202.1 hypothetical protein OIE47_00850 [Micromonospora sp. NBC_01796]